MSLGSWEPSGSTNLGRPEPVDFGTPLIEIELTEDEAVEGYRMWFLIPVDGRRLLAPVALDMHRPWNPDGPSIANCVLPESGRFPGPHEAPVPECRCGLYAMRELNAVVGGGAMDPEERLRYAVLGRARLWGRTMVGPNGWRAEFARVTKLLSLPGQEQTVLEVASAYGVPVGRLPEPVRFEGGPLDGIIQVGRVAVAIPFTSARHSSGAVSASKRSRRTASGRMASRSTESM